jgi:hypothetical protein
MARQGAAFSLAKAKNFLHYCPSFFRTRAQTHVPRTVLLLL